MAWNALPYPDFRDSECFLAHFGCYQAHLVCFGQGFVPRQLVHQQNLLHRGIGLFVTAEQPISEQPEVYATWVDVLGGQEALLLRKDKHAVEHYSFDVAKLT